MIPGGSKAEVFHSGGGDDGDSDSGDGDSDSGAAGGDDSGGGGGGGCAGDDGGGCWQFIQMPGSVPILKQVRIDNINLFCQLFIVDFKLR